MNTKFPFSNVGFHSLQSELYQLNDEQLLIVSQSVDTNFDHWMKEHFEISEQQFSYLKLIDPKVKKLLSFNTSFALANRLPISLAKDGEGTGDDQGKIIWPKSTLSAKSGGQLGFEASGSLTIHISYQS